MIADEGRLRLHKVERTIRGFEAVGIVKGDALRGHPLAFYRLKK
jgi:hypothetical protein